MKFSGSVNPNTIQDAWAEPHHADFGAARFIEPIGIVGAIAALDGARASGLQASFTPPSDSSVQNYLSRMHVGEALDDLGVAHSMPKVRARPLAADLLELQRISGEYAGDRVGNLVMGKLHDAGVDPQVCESLHSAIGETAINIAYHAEVEYGWVAAQTVQDRVYFAIADAGIGLRRALEKKMSVNDDQNAIDLAVVANVSSTAERGRGQGLPDVVTTASGLGGRISIVSGNAISSFVGDTVTRRLLSAPFDGTLIQVSLPL